MTFKKFALLFGVAILPALHVIAQQQIGAIATPQINSTFYVGTITGFYPTIQSAVTAACATSGAAVDIPAGSTPSDTIAAVTGGCTTAGIIDHRVIPAVSYALVSGVYVAQGGGSVTAGAMQTALASQTGCTTAGFAWNPATNTCAAASVTATTVAAAISTQTGCATAGFVWVPQSNTCVAQSSGTVTHSTSALTANHLVLGNGLGDVKPDTVAATDGAGNVTFASVTVAGATNGAQKFTYTGTAAPSPSTNQFQISPAIPITTPWSFSPAAAPGSGFLKGTNTGGVVQQSFVAFPVSAPLLGTDSSGNPISVSGVNPFCAGSACSSQNNFSFTTTAEIVLTVAMGTTDTSLTVTSTTGFPAAGCGYIHSTPVGEAICWSGETSTTLTGLTRGFYGSTAVVHSIGDGINGYIQSIALSTTANPAYIVSNAGGVSYNTVAAATTAAVGFNSPTSFGAVTSMLGLNIQGGTTLALFTGSSVKNGQWNASTGLLSTPRFNANFYVADGTINQFPSIQSAVTAACTATNTRVIIPANGSPSDTIAAITGGCTSVGIEDQRTIPTATYQWQSTSYIQLPSPAQAQANAIAAIPQGGGLASGVTPQFEAFAYASSGTTLTDQSGNGFNCTFATGNNAPNFNTAGNGIVFNFALHSTPQYITCPNGVLNGALTIQVWYQPSYPMAGDATATVPSILLSDTATHSLAWMNSRMGGVAVYTGQTEGPASADRFVGNTSVSLVCSTNATWYVNGKSATGTLISGACPTWAASGNIGIGSLISSPTSFNFGGTIYAILVYPTALTAAQIYQNDTFVKSQLYQHGVTAFVDSKYPATFIYEGDSRLANFTNNQALTTSRGYDISLLEPGREQFYNWGIPSQPLSTINTNIAVKEYPVLAANSSVSKTILLDAGTNDIYLTPFASGATVYTAVQSFCTNVHANAPGTKVIYSTSVARETTSAAEEAQREALNTAVISGWLAGSLICDGVDDTAGDPIAATQVVPNNYNPSGTAAFNTTWFNDGVHYTPALNLELSTGESVGILAGQGRLDRCTVINKQIPYQVLVAANTVTPSLTQAIPLLQLGPGWQVCSLSSNVSTAFAGTSVTGLTMSLGDSTGTTTQYQTTQSLLATGAVVSNPTFTSAKGIVQMNFTAVGGNLSAMTAGNINIQIGVKVVP